MDTKKLEKVAKQLPPWMGRLGKRFAVHIRANQQLRACQNGYKKFGDKYTQPILFIAGLPKSGSTWIEKMVASYDGYHEYLLPAVATHELSHGGSHNFEFPTNMFSKLKEALILTKMHSHGSKNNVEILERANLNYVILHRDLRDVAVSYHFYVQNTPWHPEHAKHKNKSIQDGLLVFAEGMLSNYVSWVNSWKENANPNNSIQIRYEDMLADPVGGMTKIANLFDLDSNPKTIKKIVDKYSFKTMSGGRQRGENANKAFARKGIAGDWKNHFTPKLRKLYGEILGDFLISAGDEEDCSWINDG